MTTAEIAPAAVQIPSYARTYADAMGRTQYAVDGPRGTFLVTRKNDREPWSVWRNDSLNTNARMANTVRAIERAAELAGIEIAADDAPATDTASDRTVGMTSTGVSVLHRPSGKEFGLCHGHEHALDDADGIVTVGPLFGDFRCIVCDYADTSADESSPDADAAAEVPDTFDKDDLKAMCVLANDFTAFDLADHLADVMPETVNGRRIWNMTPLELAKLAVSHYPGGAAALQLALEG